jgi:hypothetical protein
VARAAMQKDANVTNAPSGINAPSSVTTLATSIVFMYDRLQPNQAGTIFLDGVSQGAAPATNASGYNSVAVSVAGLAVGIHEVAFSGASGQIAIAPLYVTQSLVTPTPPLITFTPTITNTPTATPNCVPQSYSIANGTGSIVAGTTDTGNHCDDCDTTVALPFPVSLYGLSFTSAQVGSNGFLSFGTSDDFFYSGCLPDATATYNIFPFEVDQTTGAPGKGIFTLTTGTAPNRTFYIEWRNCQYGTATSCLANSSTNYEIVFQEGSSSFNIVYGTFGTADATAGAIGVQLSSTVFTQSQCNVGAPASTQQTYSYNPGTCFTPTPPPTATITNTATATPTVICPGDWTQQAPVLAPLLDSGVVSLGGKLYSFAGVVSGAISANSYVYDPGTNLWTAIAPLPAGREWPSAVTDGTLIYIMNGADSTGANTSTLYSYNPGTNLYTTLASDTVATWAQTAAYLNGKIYKIAGCAANCGSFVNTVEAYDITAGTWTTVANHTDSVGFLMSTAMGNFVYTAGGIGAAGESAKTYRYDPIGNLWDDASIADLPATRWGSAEDNHNGLWLVAGGYSGNVVVSSAVTWNPISNSWSGIDPMLQARARLGGATIGAQFYAVGGREPGGAFAGNTDNQRYVNICLPTPTPTFTPTPAAANLVGHVTWQQVPQPSTRSVLPITLTLKLGTSETNYPVQNTDISGFFTVSVLSLAPGTYDWRVQGPDGPAGGNTGPGFLANCGTVALAGAPQTNSEMGTMKGGDANNSNLVDSSDFTILKNDFGHSGTDRADFNNSNVVDSSDFTILKNNFGQAGCSRINAPVDSKDGSPNAAPPVGNSK